jgi:hypothetical protein
MTTRHSFPTALAAASVAVLAVLSLALPPPVAFAQTLRATTQDGRAVVLRPDGTWAYESAAQGTSAAPSDGQVPKTATQSIADPKVGLKIWYDDHKWTASTTRKLNPEASISFFHAAGDAYAMVISERIQIPLSTLQEVSISKAKAAAPDLVVVERSMRTVNGKSVLHMQMNGTIKGIPFTYYGTYYSGEHGVVQFVTYTSQNLLKDYQQDFDDLLNGMTIE